MSKTNSILSLITLVAFLLIGCRRVDNVVWSKYVPIPEEGWDPVNVIPFFPWPVDSIVSTDDRFSLLVSVRFTGDKCPAPLHLVIKQDDDDGHEQNDTLKIDIRMPQTTPTGKGAYAVYEQVDTALTGIRLHPGYSVELQSLSHPSNTSGIKDVGLILRLENDEENFLSQLKKIKI